MNAMVTSSMKKRTLFIAPALVLLVLSLCGTSGAATATCECKGVVSAPGRMCGDGSATGSVGQQREVSIRFVCSYFLNQNPDAQDAFNETGTGYDNIYAGWSCTKND